MRAQGISRVDGGGCCGTLATRWWLKLWAKRHLPHRLMERGRRLRWRARSRLERAWAEGSAILMRVLSSSMRTAILRNALRMVSKVAVRQIERWRGAPEFVQEPVKPPYEGTDGTDWLPSGGRRCGRRLANPAQPNGILNLC